MFSKNKIIKYGALVGVLITMFGLLGCARINTKELLFGKEKDSNKKIVFAQLSQEERQKYVKDYLKERYGLDCSVTEIKKRRLDSAGMHLEDDYLTIATANDGVCFTVWITDEGEIKDTAYMYFLKDDVNSYFEKKLNDNGIDGKVIARFYIDEYSPRKWNANELDEMFAEENIYGIIDLYTTNKNVDTDLIQKTLQGYQGEVLIHYKEYDANNIDFKDDDKIVLLD